MSAPVVAAARQWLGTPYRHRASTLGAGCDCLGLLRGVWRTLNGDEPADLPPYRADARGADEGMGLTWAAKTFLIPADGPPSAGQVVLFALIRNRPARHCGILIAPDRFIHAQEQLGVVEANLTEAWARRVAGRYVFPQLQGSPWQP